MILGSGLAKFWKIGFKMTTINRSRVVTYSCEQMYHLVNDVKKYHEFLPHFDEAIVHHQDDDELCATLVISFSGMKKSFTTRSRLQQNKMIEIRLVDGPFSHLEGFWRFNEVDEGCLVMFDLEYQFSSRMVAMLVEPFFEPMATKMLDAFCMQAEVLYGSS